MLTTDFKILGNKHSKNKWMHWKIKKKFIKGYWVGDLIAGILLLTLQTIFILRIDWKQSAQKVCVKFLKKSQKSANVKKWKQFDAYFFR